MKTLSQHDLEFKKEINELLEIFKFEHRVGELDRLFYDRVYFVKSETYCYHNLSFSDNIPFGLDLTDSIDNYSVNIELHTNYKSGVNLRDINEKCSSIDDLRSILKRRFPKDWNFYKRKNILNILGN